MLRRPLMLPFASSLLALALLAPALAVAKCDTAANAAPLASARVAIDAACPCAAATSPGQHGKCAKVVVNDRVEHNQLVKTCRSEALNHAKKSICGRPGAAVCCRTKAGGKTAHKIVKSAAKCTSTATLTACTSEYPTIDTGCDVSGCIAPVCGNDIVEPTEACDPPNRTDVCDANCQLVTCEPPVTLCGNGTLDGGEACEPPGTGSCGWDCQATACAAAGPGEIAVACVQGDATVAAGSRGDDYLLAWSGLVDRNDEDVVARRFDANGAALDPRAAVVSHGVPCGGKETEPAVGGAGGRYVLAWAGSGPALDTPFYLSVYTRTYGSDAALGTLDERERRLPFGMCQSLVSGPMAVSPVPADGAGAFAALWYTSQGCAFTPVFQNPDGIFVDYAPSTPVTTELAPGYPITLPPSVTSQSPATIAALPTDTLMVWHAATGVAPSLTDPFVSGAWLAADGAATKFSLSTRSPGIGAALRPTIAAATDRYLVAWAQGPVDDATEIRGMRVTHAGGALDADGGLLLATTAGGKVVGAPVAAFDGTVWLAAWTEVGVGGNDLRAVAVQTDGTVVDATPRLLASGLGGAQLGIASAGDGRALVVYVRPDGGSSAVRAQLVPGS